MKSLVDFAHAASMRGIICLVAVIGVSVMGYNRVDNPVAYAALSAAIGGYFGNLAPKPVTVKSDTNVTEKDAE